MPFVFCRWWEKLKGDQQRISAWMRSGQKPQVVEIDATPCPHSKLGDIFILHQGMPRYIKVHCFSPHIVPRNGGDHV